MSVSLAWPSAHIGSICPYRARHNTAHRVTPSTVSFGFHSIWKVLFPHQNVINECLLCTQPHIMSHLLDGGSNLDIVYILYQIIYLCHLAPLSWGRRSCLTASGQCLLNLFVCHHILCDTWSHSSMSEVMGTEK